jgi:hypothetical protein
MPVNKDLSDLPPATPSGGIQPSATSILARPLADAWWQQYQDSGAINKPKVIPELPYRGSDASRRCDRALGFTLSGEPRSDEVTPSGHWRMGLGTMVHNEMQALLASIWPDAEFEVPLDLTVIGIPGSQSADILIDKTEHGKVVGEIKTKGGFQFKGSTTAFKGPPSGPQDGELEQLATAVCAADADIGVLVYFAMESVSVDTSANLGVGEYARFCAEFQITRAEAEAIVDYERKRINRVLAAVRAGQVPTRQIHSRKADEGAVIFNPKKGAWRAGQMQPNGDFHVTNTGTIWYCGYCPWQATCIEQNEGTETESLF